MATERIETKFGPVDVGLLEEAALTALVSAKLLKIITGLPDRSEIVLNSGLLDLQEQAQNNAEALFAKAMGRNLA